MKKMMMFLMVSVFFLVGGMTESMAQKKKNVAEKSSSSSAFLYAKVGDSVKLYFHLEKEHSNWQAIGLCFQQSAGSNLKCLIVLYRSGHVLYSPPIDGRISITFDASRNMVIVTLNSVKAEDEGRYYFVVQVASGEYFWSPGDYLTVDNSPYH